MSQNLSSAVILSEKHCLSRGCLGYPMHGFGRPSGTMVWACRNHQALLPGNEVAKMATTDVRPTVIEPHQGSLFG